MSLVIDANMKFFADHLNISSSRMIQDYGLSTVDEIIEAEAAQGNSAAVDFARRYCSSPERLIKVFELTNVENRYVLLHKMDHTTREKLLPLLEKDDLAMGLYFFTQDKLLQMLMETDIEELVNVIKEAFPLEQIIMMFKEEELAEFFKNDDLEKFDVLNQLKALPPEIMLQFVEGVTGMPANETDPMDLINSIASLPENQYQKFMASIDPEIQRQLTFQLTKEKPEYLTLFQNQTYVDMLSTLIKPDMVKPMIMLNKETLVEMISELPDDLMSIVGAQIDTRELAKFLQDGHMDLLKEALMV